VIVRILDGEAYCDMNHPLAGQDLTFDVELVEKL
jgi:FKBP-type peptidyl-prolyl cis-trans isomerase 2